MLLADDPPGEAVTAGGGAPEEPAPAGPEPGAPTGPDVVGASEVKGAHPVPGVGSRRGPRGRRPADQDRRRRTLDIALVLLAVLVVAAVVVALRR